MSDSDILKRVPPQNIEAEQSVLGAALLDNAALDEVIHQLKPEHFQRESNREIYKHMVALSGRNEAIDAITLSESLRTGGVFEAVGGAGYIAELAASVPSAANIGHYARIVRDKAQLRGMATAATRIAGEAYDGPEDVPSFADRAMNDFSEVATQAIEHRVVWGSELAYEGFNRVETAYKHKSRITGLATGLLDFDHLTAGLQRKDLIVIAARPSLGKSALALKIAAHVAGKGYGRIFLAGNVEGTVGAAPAVE
jgi:replicative DNA helicase